jgi:hypothetical protein
MRLRSAALALALTFSLNGLVEAKTHTHKHKIVRQKARKHNVRKANRAAAKQIAKQRKRRAA